MQFFKSDYESDKVSTDFKKNYIVQETNIKRMQSRDLHVQYEDMLSK